MFEGFLVRERENNTFVQKTIFIFSAKGKTPEFLQLNLANMLYVWKGNTEEVLYYITEP